MVLWHLVISYIDSLVQDCSNYSALAMEFLQSCIKPLICNYKSCNYDMFTKHVGFCWGGWIVSPLKRLRLEQYGHHIADDILKCVSLMTNGCILNQLHQSFFLTVSIGTGKGLSLLENLYPYQCWPRPGMLYGELILRWSISSIEWRVIFFIM